MESSLIDGQVFQYIQNVLLMCSQMLLAPTVHSEQ